MNVELVNTGSELMLGRILNTHQQWLCRRLADAGLVVSRQIAVPDSGPAIRDAVADALHRADLVICTGGLGPTSDDLTRDLIAELLGTRLVEDATVLANIESYFSLRKRTPPARVAVQAQVPEGAIVLPNAHGTAPGLAIEIAPGRFRESTAWLILLPGPPRELRPMFDGQVLPLLVARLPARPAFHCVTLRTCGVGESWVEERLAAPLASLIAEGLDLGYCARSGEVDVRLTATGETGAVLVAKAEGIVRHELGPSIFGTGDDLLESVVIRLAAERNATLALAESCTGGLLAHRLTNIPGASAVLWGGWIVYDNAAKERQLGVAASTLAQSGAVSNVCAREMAEGALARSGAQYALAITGIAGPSGGTPEKPVGTVFIALASQRHPTKVRRHLHPYDRETFKYVTSQQALEMLRRQLLADALRQREVD